MVSMNNLKPFLFLIPLTFLSCVNGDIYSELARNIINLLSEPEDIAHSKIESIPYASMQVRLGRSDNTLLILEEEKNGILKWTSSNLIKIYTKNGFIIRLTGLDNELDQIELDKKHPILTGNFNKNFKSYTSFYTFNKPKLFRLPVKTNFKFIRNEPVNILGEIVPAKLYEEISTDNLISWQFKNLYWINNQNEIIKSVQNFTPKNPEIYLKLTKKYKKPK